MKGTKLNLKALEVKSFKTANEKRAVKGGKPESWFTNCPEGSYCESYCIHHCEVDW
ncbi:MAG: hypothetical protein WBB45_11335 [Cyclobacteriaceae bacterium]